MQLDGQAKEAFGIWHEVIRFAHTLFGIGSTRTSMVLLCLHGRIDPGV